MFDTDLGREYEAARGMGLLLRGFFEAGLAGALCEETTLEQLRRRGDNWDWSAVEG